jgi:hypothetical protein
VLSKILNLAGKNILPISIVLAVLLLVGFWDKIPFISDIKLAFTGWLSDRRIAAYDEGISDLNKRIDSLNARDAVYQRANDSLGGEISLLRASVARRSKSIDSIKRVLSGLETNWNAHEGKESLYGQKIPDVNRFVDSMLTYRDSVLNSGRQ